MPPIAMIRPCPHIAARARTALAGLACIAVSGAALADEAAFLQCRQLAEAMPRLACYDAVQASVGAAAPAQHPTPEQFGIEQRLTQGGAQAIESTIPGRFQGWSANDRITLANGQVWQISDDSSGYVSARDPKVRVRRGVLGAYYLEIEGTSRSPRVRRLD
jgi:hypothetical protein